MHVTMRPRTEGVFVCVFMCLRMRVCAHVGMQPSTPTTVRTPGPWQYTQEALNCLHDVVFGEARLVVVGE